MFWLTGYIGKGTDGDPFRPFGADELDGWSAIDLRPDSAKVDGFALLAGAALPMKVGRISLGDDPDASSVAVRNGIQSKVGITLADSKLRRIVRSLLVEHATPPGDKTRWNPLQPELVGGVRRYRIYLGGLFDEFPVLAGGAVITESFNKADSTTLGPGLSWTEVVGDLAVVSNTLRGGGSPPFNAHARAESDLATVDHYAQFSLVTLNDTGGGTGSIVLVRSRFATAADTSYMFRRSKPTGATGTYRLDKRVAGTTTALTSAGTQALSVPETIRCEISGSSLVGKISGSSVATVTDTAITTGTRCGIGLFNDGVQGDAVIDSFEAGDITTAVARSFGLSVGASLPTTGPVYAGAEL